MSENEITKTVHCQQCGTEQDVQIIVPLQSEDTMTRSAYCPRCNADRIIRITVPWQADICTRCGENVDTGLD